ncbi:MAG TPA: GntR family transcriptional regulator [Pseudonocardiaceae bacterium]|nr:GntR family transcriptional regulator [Pseudonocardiaceae bacterium]
MTAADSPGVGLTTAAARVIMGSGTEPVGRADQIAHRLGRAIRLGLILDGERLPSEIQLAEQLGIANVTLREALATLREQGLVLTRRGRAGGTFVRAPLDADPGALPARVAALSTQHIRELADHRTAIATTVADLAAQRSLPDEVDDLLRQVERLRAARTPSERRRADTQFTILLASAAQSSRLTTEAIRLLAEIGDLLWLRLSPAEHDAAVRVRFRLVDAVGKRQRARAREAAEHLVAADTRRLLALGQDDASGGRWSVRAGREVLATVSAEFERIIAALRPLADRFAAIEAPNRERLAALREPIFHILAENRDLVAGAGAIVAPGLLTDADHWLEWWWTRPSGTPEALRVNLDPTAPDFFEYPAAEWYRTPERTLAGHVAGPYVDYACTTEYATTVALAVRAGERFLGIVAADVPVSRLERRVLPALRELGRPVALTNAAGRVIASSRADCLPGQLLPLDELTPIALRGPDSVLDWCLVELPG